MKKFKRLTSVVLCLLILTGIATSCKVTNDDKSGSSESDPVSSYWESSTSSENGDDKEPEKEPEKEPTKTSSKTPSKEPEKEPEKEPTIKQDMYGLQVTSAGVITLNGRPFYGMGVNFHGAYRYAVLPGYTGGTNFYNLDKTLKPLKDNGVPFIRCMLGIFYPSEVDLYVNNPDKYFKAMDEFFDTCQKNQVGVIGSMMWNLTTFTSYYGEDVSALANPNSKGSKLAVKYVKDIAKRYKNHPALWAYEVGNEGNLGADLKHVDANQSNLTTAILNAYYKMVGQAIRTIDSKRLIVGGDAEPRGHSNSLRDGNGWSKLDTYEDTKESLDLYTPDPLNCVSVHVYNENGSTASSNVRDFDTMIKRYVKAARELRIGLFVGEYGPGATNATLNDNDVIGPSDPREKLERDNFYAAYNAIINNGVQISAQWCYHRTEQEDGTAILPGIQVNGNSTINKKRNTYQWEAVINANKTFRNSNKNNAAEYWAGV